VSVVFCQLDDEGWTQMGTVKVGEASTDMNAGSYQKRYKIGTSTMHGPQSLISLGQAAGLPALWSTYSLAGDTDTYSYARSYTIERVPKTTYLYFVTVNYEPASEGEMGDPALGLTTPIMAQRNPLIRKPVIWWDREVFTHTAQTQYDGKALTNPVNGLYDDLVESERSRAVMVVEWNVQYGYSIAEYTERWDQAVNNSGWTFLGKTYDPRQVVVREVSSGKVVTEGSYNYYKARMRLAIAAKNETWDEPIPQLARHYFTKSSSASFDEEPGQAGVYKRTAAPDLVPVNDDGTRRPDNQPILVRKVRARKEENFTQLPFVALV